MKKAVAVPYVIALILGIAVLGLVGIWFVTSGGKFTKQSSDTFCNNEKTKICTKWVSTSILDNMPAGCSGFTFADPTRECRELLGLCKKAGERINACPATGAPECCSGRCNTVTPTGGTTFFTCV